MFHNKFNTKTAAFYKSLSEPKILPPLSYYCVSVLKDAS